MDRKIQGCLGKLSFTKFQNNISSEKNILLLNAVKEKKQLRLSRFQDLSDVILVLGKNNIIYALPIHGETLIYFFMYFKKLKALAFFRKAR